MPYRNGLLVLLLLGAMEALSGFAVLTGLGLVDAGPLHGAIFWLFLFAVWVGTASEFVAAGTEDNPTRVRVAIVVAALLVCVVPPVVLAWGNVAGDILSAMLLGLFFWRGMVITPRETDHFEVQRRFGLRLAFILFGIVVLVARGETERQSLWLMLSLAGIGYVVAGFAALGISRLDEARAEDGDDTGAVAVGTPVATILVLSFGALALVSINILGLMAAVVSPIWDVITRGIALALTVLALPLFFVAAHLHFNPRAIPLHPPKPAQQGRLPQSHGIHHGITVWDALGIALIVLVILLLTLLIVALILRATRSRESQQRDQDDKEERRSLATPRDIVRLFLAWIRGLFRRGTASAARVVEATHHRVLGPSYPTDPVRRVYAQVLYRAARQGLPRSPTTTPAEFVSSLQSRWPQGRAQFASVTEAYMRRRYAEQDASAEEVRNIRSCWHELRGIMRHPSESIPR